MAHVVVDDIVADVLSKRLGNVVFYREKGKVVVLSSTAKVVVHEVVTIDFSKSSVKFFKLFRWDAGWKEVLVLAASKLDGEVLNSWWDLAAVTFGLPNEPFLGNEFAAACQKAGLQ